jgi:predicted Zn-dependent protease
MTPMAFPESAIDWDREQASTLTVIEHANEAFPLADVDSDATLIAITPVDVYHDADDNYAFGSRGTLQNAKAVVSTARMDFGIFGRVGEETMFSRARKLTTKYIGLLYYGLSPSDDPESPMFDVINGLGDLDRMSEPLPIFLRLVVKQPHHYALVPPQPRIRDDHLFPAIKCR